MKVKHTKLKKSIFLILICISLTTTFVVSASADYYPNRFLEIYIDDGSGNVSPYFRHQLGYYLVTGGYFQTFNFILIEDASLIDPTVSGPFTEFSVTYGPDIYYEGFESPLLPYKIDSFFINDIEYFVDYQPMSGDYAGFYSGSIVYDQPDSGDVVVKILNDSSSPSPSPSPSFIDRVTSGLTSSLSWVGQVVESLTTGPIKPLLECFAVTISVSALLLGIYSIRRFIWGS